MWLVCKFCKAVARNRKIWHETAPKSRSPKGRAARQGPKHLAPAQCSGFAHRLRCTSTLCTRAGGTADLRELAVSSGVQQPTSMTCWSCPTMVFFMRFRKVDLPALMLPSTHSVTRWSACSTCQLWRKFTIFSHCRRVRRPTSSCTPLL